MSKQICMLAHLYESKRVIFPAYIQPKLNGIRAIWLHKEKRFVSRKNKPLSVPEQIVDLVSFSPYDLDGELLIPGLPLNKISGAVRLHDVFSKRKHDLNYTIFDIIDLELKTVERHKKLTEAFRFSNSKYVQIIRNQPVSFTSEIDSIHFTQLQLGYEGSIIRNNAPYEFKRSFNLLKLKPRQRIECKVIGMLEGTGKYENMLGALTVKTPQGKIFNIGTGFNDKERDYIWGNPAERYNNIFVIVEFRDYSEFGIPIEASFKGFKNESK